MRLIDCDVHPSFPHPDGLADYLAPAARNRFLARPVTSVIFPPPNGGTRVDARPVGGGRPGSDPELFRKQLLDDSGIDVAIHIPNFAGQALDPDFNAQVQMGVNDWMADKWLGEYNDHGRYRSSITLPINNINAAVHELERWADHPYFVQAWLPHRSQVPYGNRLFHPLWEVAARHRLPVAIHANSSGQTAMSTPVGFSRYYMELHAVAESLAYVSHLLSFLCEGVFERFPGFRLVLVEGGYAWLGPLMWRLDKSWRAMRSEFPLLKRPPSEYIYEQVRFTTQPVEEPDRPKDLLRLYEMTDASRLLMFATDYPHWDFDDPKRVLPRLSPQDREKVAYGNAAELYGLN
ncbi:MAG: amidohydrolase family protein [Fimbriimonadales bacterium]